MSDRVDGGNGASGCGGSEIGERVARILEARPARESELIHVLQDLNDELGFLPMSALQAAAARLGVPLSRMQETVEHQFAGKTAAQALNLRALQAGYDLALSQAGGGAS